MRPRTHRSTEISGSSPQTTHRRPKRFRENIRSRHLRRTKDERYISLSGTAVITRDATKARSYGNPYKTWFPGGLADHILHCSTSGGKSRILDASASKMVNLFHLAKAVFTVHTLKTWVSMRNSMCERPPYRANLLAPVGLSLML